MAKKQKKQENVVFEDFTEKQKNFIYQYLNNASPTGFESSGQKIWMNYLKKDVDDFLIDNYGTVAAILNPGKKFKVVIEAHSDEISWFVHYITKEGFIYLRKNGGSDPLIAPSKRVNIFTDNGVVKGIFGWPAIHMRNLEKDTMPALGNIFIDIGCKSKEEAEEMGIKVGDVVTFEDELIELNNRFFVGRALDNRIGGFMIAEVIKKLKANKVELPFTLYAVNSVQEEIGLKGAEMIARNIQPDVAIITDVCHDTQSPMINKINNGDLSMNKGPVLTIGPAVQRNLFKLIEETAKENNIETQRQAVSRATGTDTDAFAYAGAGVVSALISLPLRYMHTTVEMVAKKDIQAVIDLIYNTLLKIEDQHDFKYIK